MVLQKRVIISSSAFHISVQCFLQTAGALWHRLTDAVLLLI